MAVFKGDTELVTLLLDLVLPPNHNNPSIPLPLSFLLPTETPPPPHTTLYKLQGMKVYAESVTLAAVLGRPGILRLLMQVVKISDIINKPDLLGQTALGTA